MRHKITIYSVNKTLDEDGFATQTRTVFAKVHAAVEIKNSTEKWSNRAILTDASAIFRMRYIGITTDMLIEFGGKMYNVKSVEDVKNKHIYLEVIAALEE